MRSPTRHLAISLALFSCWITATPAYAWGPLGHAIVAEIAVDHLNPEAKRAVDDLLRDTNLFAAANWPDAIRSALPETDSWHYVNIPTGAAGYLASRDCRQDDCVVAKIVWFSAVLRDQHQSRAARIVALKFLIHLVGDIHQPFHASAVARGGNDIPVTFFGTAQCGGHACELHEVWDESLIGHAQLGVHAYADLLEKMIAETRLEPGTENPETWANESFQLAKEATVPAGTDIGQSYYDREWPILNRQLALAGLRLADFLNQDLGSDDAVPAGNAAAEPPATTMRKP